MKPVVTGSLAGYDKLLGDIGTIGRLGGNPDLGKGLELMLQMLTHGKGLAGLDKSRPLASVLLTDGQQFIPYVFIPVTDLKQLVEVAKTNPQLAENITLDDGVYEIGAGSQTIYLQQTGNWAVMTDQERGLGPRPRRSAQTARRPAAEICFGVPRVGQERPRPSIREQILAQLQAVTQVGMSDKYGR